MSVYHRGHNGVSNLLKMELHLIVTYTVASEI